MSSTDLNFLEGSGSSKQYITGKNLKHAVKTKHCRAETVVHSDTEWKPDDDSEEYASSGVVRIRA